MKKNKQWGLLYKNNGASIAAPEKSSDGRRLSYSMLTKAKNADNFIYTKSSYQQSPDLYVSADLKSETKLSAINPQQSQYNWGNCRNWCNGTTPKGYHSKGHII